MQSVLAFNALSALSYLLLTLLFRRPAVKRCLCSIGIVHSIVGGQRLLRVRWPHPIIPYFQSNHHISYHEPINIFRSRNIHIYIYMNKQKNSSLYIKAKKWSEQNHPDFLTIINGILYVSKRFNQFILACVKGWKLFIVFI